MRYVVYGAGGIGSGIGGHLWRTGHDAALIGRPGHVEKIRAEGLTLITPDETYALNVPAYAHPSEIEWRDDDAILLCMKGQDTEAALRDLRDAGAHPQRTAIFCTQNSITNEPLAARYFARVYGVLIVVPGIYLEDGIVHNPIRGNAGFMEIGRYPRGVDPLCERVACDLTAASYAAFPHENVMAPKGAKMLGNLGNALGAISDGKGDTERYMRPTRDEGRQALDAAGLPCEEAESFAARSRSHRGESASPEGMRNLGSSWQSLMRRQGTIEADFLNGEIVRLGKIHGIATPFNRVLQLVATEMARNRERPGRYTADELYEMAEKLGASDAGPATGP